MFRVPYRKLQSLYVPALAAAYREYQRRHRAENFYAYAVYSDGDASTVVPAASTEQSLQRVKARYFDAGESAKTISPHHLRWCPDEWSYSGSFGKSGEAMSPASALHEEFEERLSETSDELDLDEDFHGHRTKMFEMMLGCLKTLNRDGFWGKGTERAQVTLMFWVTDYHEAPEWWIRSVEELNPASVFKRFQEGLPAPAPRTKRR